MSLKQLNLYRGLFIISLNLLYVSSSAQSADKNYIQTKTFLNENASSFLRHIDYYDELGFVTETVDVGLNASGTPLVTKTEYNTHVKPLIEWLPVPSASLDFISDVSDMAEATYDDVCPWRWNEYEDFDRLSCTWKPGYDWNEHFATNTYDAVSAGVVRKYSVDSNGNLIDDGMYPRGVLTSTTSIDEDGHCKKIITNLHEDIILERIIDMNDANTVYDTYYVYDKFGRLSYVLPPMCQQCSITAMSDYWYKYSYDDRGRCIEKQLPGCASTTLVYDNKNRVVITQDPLLREKGLYRFMLYDDSGRIAIQGTTENYDTSLVNEFNATKATSGNGLFDSGYNFSETLFLNSINIEMINYYDDYAFFEHSMLGETIKAKMRNPNYTPIINSNRIHSRGSLTGQVVNSSDGNVLFNAFYYNNKGLVIDERHSTLDNNVYKVFTEYSFTNKPTQVTKIVPCSTIGALTNFSDTTSDGLPSQFDFSSPTQPARSKPASFVDYSIITNYTYNPYNDQLQTVSIQCGDNATPVVVSSLTYDDLGRVETNSRPDINDVISYDYDLHGWTTAINGTYFKETLHYADGPDSVKCYNGNISAQTWMASDSIQRGYKFKYNERNMLCDAFYGEGTSLMVHTGRYNENITEFDSNGAIVQMNRKGMRTPDNYAEIDKLVYDYEGNKVTKIRDLITTQLSYNGAFEYRDTHNATDAEPDFTYNSAGMLISDRDKQVRRITYNDVGLVDSILFSNGANVAYTYGMNGEKLKVVHHTISATASSPIPGRDIISFKDRITTNTTEYIGGDVEVESQSLAYGITSYKYYFGDGYVQFYPGGTTVPKYYYYSKDHLGNVRSVVTKNPSTGVVSEVQKTHYYPFGGIIADISTGTSVQNKLYNGKELDTSNNLWWYDYGARQYDPTRGQFTNFDQHCESYYSTNPLTYCGNNPIGRIDPTGMDWYKKTDENEAISYTWQEGSDDIEGYENIGANHSETFGNVTYNYEQNEMVSMTETVLSPKDWSSQMANSSEKKTMPFGNCFYQAGEMVKKSGATSYDGVSYNISGNDNMQSYIDSQIDRGFSTRVHVDRQNKSNAFDGVGDHWVAISSRTTNFRNNEISYNYYDPGTCRFDRGTSSNNRFVYQNNVWTAPAPNNNKYNMVHVRLNR